MKKAAIGIRVHSGWGALVALSGETGAEEVIERARIAIVDIRTEGVSQPYHFAQRLNVREGEKAAEQHVVTCAAAASHMALAAIREVVERLRDNGYRIAGAAILLGSGRPLPAFGKILASHPMLHTAEGVFFRQAFREAFEELKIPVAGIPERQLEQRVSTAFGKRSAGVHKRIVQLGRSLGPPWTQDQKSAALAAIVVLAENKR
jgi:hypothetical protein